ncbi:hypothetical protein ACFQY0_20795 [Haloferula chungangensis]|uniref:Uncharacterized protein n=1 Tax=Haloferula chungangensis TaxID=1048331 RepID=A0ABW2LDJ7_9BACT
MGYYLSEPAPSKSDPTAKDRVWGFVAESDLANLESRPAARQLHRENYGESWKTASGIPLWPSRDPIGERGGMNLYGMIENDAVNLWDFMGLLSPHMAYPTTGYNPSSGDDDDSSCECPEDVGNQKNLRFRVLTLTYHGSEFEVKDPASTIGDVVRDHLDKAKNPKKPDISEKRDVQKKLDDIADDISKAGKWAKLAQEIGSGVPIMEIRVRIQGDLCFEESEEGSTGYAWKTIEGNGIREGLGFQLMSEPEKYADALFGASIDAANDHSAQLPK